MSRDKHQVFVSFSHRDEARARALIKELRLVPDLEVSASADEFDVGTNWQRKLRRDLEASDLVVLFLTKDAIASDWIRHELGAAWAMRKPLAVVAEDPRLADKLAVRDVNVIIDDDDPRAVAQRVADAMKIDAAPMMADARALGR